MEVVANSFMPGDPHLVDKIVYELKAQGIFDQFRKECFADVDTKPAYQNLRQRVEGSVAGFLKEQSWRPDMNKNQVREMLRKTITESGYLETGVERIVDQVVNPKINSIFLPKVEEVVYSYLGLKKPNKNDPLKSEQSDLLPNDLEAVSPESDHDKKEDRSAENFQEMDETKTEEDESPPFEPLEEQSIYVPQEENSVDSHMSGFSGLVSHESNQSNDNKVTPLEQDSQMSRNSSDSRLSIVTSDENSKMEICEDSQPKASKINEANSKHESDKNKHKSSNRHKSRSESKSDRDRKSSKDSRSRHCSSSKDKDKSRDRKDSKSTSTSNKNDKDKPKEKTDKDKNKSSSSSSKHSSHSSSSSSKEKNGKKESSKSDKDKDRKSSSSNNKDSKPKDKSSDSKSKEKSSYDKHKHSSSSSSHSDKHKKDKDKDKKKEKSKDDHYSSKDKKNDRRSTDRDSNDGQSSRQNPPQNNESNSSQSQKSNQESSGGGDSGNSDQTEHTTKAPVVVTDAVEDSEVTISAPDNQKLKLFKPKCASNMQEALRLRKIRKQLAKLEKKNQLSLTSVNLDSPILLNASINLDELNPKCNNAQQMLNNKVVSDLEVVPSPLQSTVISQDNWDTMEAKLQEEVNSEYRQSDDSLDENVGDETHVIDDDNIADCKYFDNVDIKKIEFILFIENLVKKFEKQASLDTDKIVKRKFEDTDAKNNNKLMSPEKKAKLAKKNKEKINSHSDILVNEKFPLPLSPAESEKSVSKKEDIATMPLKVKRNNISKMNSQRYSSDDLYKPRPTFARSRRRGAKNLEN